MEFEKEHCAAGVARACASISMRSRTHGIVERGNAPHAHRGNVTGGRCHDDDDDDDTL